MKGPDGKYMHAELTLRGTTLMLGPENPERGARSAKTLGGSAVALYLTVENVDKVFAKAVKFGAIVVMPVMDMFWGDRCGPWKMRTATTGGSSLMLPNPRLKKCGKV